MIDAFRFQQRIALTVIFLIVALSSHAQSNLPFEVISCKYENTSSGIQNGGRGQEYYIELKFNKKTEITFDSASVNGIKSNIIIIKDGVFYKGNKFKKREKITLRYGYFKNEYVVIKKQSYIFYTYKKKNLTLETNDCEKIISPPRP